MTCGMGARICKPLYAFGYGLSYTSFAYSNLRVDGDALRQGGKTSVQFDVKNTGTREGDEVVQLYVAHHGSKVERPIEELKGFERVSLRPGEQKTVTLPLRAAALAYWNDAAHAFTVEHDGDSIEVRVGGSSDRIALHTTVAMGK
jgi:beta-glucosidase